MNDPTYNADCDLVLEMEDAGIGVEEILQYAHGVLTDNEIRVIIRGLERLLTTPAQPAAAENAPGARVRALEDVSAG